MSEEHAPYITQKNIENPIDAYLDTLSSQAGRTGQKLVLNRIALLLGFPDVYSVDWSKLSLQEVEALPGKLLEVYAPGTVNRYIGALKGILRQAYLMGLVSEEDYRRAIKLKSVEVPALEGRVLSHEVITALVRACDDGTKVGARDRAAIALMYAAGLKATEAAGLALADYENGSLTVQSSWDEERTISLHNGALDTIESWLGVRGIEPGYMLFAVRSPDNIQHGVRIFSQALSHILYKRCSMAGIPNISTRDLRNTFIHHLIDAGFDIVLVSRLAGMKDVRSIARYDRRGKEAMDEAVKSLSIPYRRSKG